MRSVQFGVQGCHEIIKHGSISAPQTFQQLWDRSTHSTQVTAPGISPRLVNKLLAKSRRESRFFTVGKCGRTRECYKPGVRCTLHYEDLNE